MQAYHNDPALKTALLAELAKHEAADALVKGTYAATGSRLPDGFKGCAIGCALHSLNLLNGEYCPTPGKTNAHDRFPTELGIPVELAYHIDTIFEQLPDAESQTWPRRVLEAIPVGADLSGVIPTLLQWMILDSTAGLIAGAQPQFHDSYRQFAALVARDWATPGTVSVAEWNAIDAALTDCPVWARARARAGARARAWAGAGAGAYTRLSEQTLVVIRASRS